MEYIRLKSPEDLESKKVKKELETLIKQGYKTFEIKLIFEFVGDFKILQNKFQVMKNRLAFNRDNLKTL
jgi:hypothetical protein